MSLYKHHRSIPTALLSLLLLLPLLLSCAASPKTESENFYVFTDDLGESVSLAEKPQRIAVLFSSFADIWKSAGGSVDITVGESVERGFADAQAILVDSGAGKTVNTELLIAARPDLVICSADVAAQVTCAELLRGYGIATACFRVEAFEDYLRVLRICTDITENKECYRTNGLEVKARIDTMLTALQARQERLEILFVRASATSVKAKSSQDHFASKMLSELGAYNIADDAPVLIDGLDPETVLQRNPSHVFVSLMGNEESAKSALLSSTALTSLDAVKNGCCHILPKELFQYKPNSRWDEAYLYLIRLLYENFEENN